jgi:hypothetical protein
MPCPWQYFIFYFLQLYFVTVFYFSAKETFLLESKRRSLGLSYCLILYFNAAEIFLMECKKRGEGGVRSLSLFYCLILSD